MDSYQPTQNAESSFAVPPIVNPPPQVFGNYSQVSPLSTSYQNNYFTDDQGGLHADESNDAKRRRIARVYMVHLSRDP